MIALLKLIRYPNLLIIVFSQLLLFYTLPSAAVFRPGFTDTSLWGLVLIIISTILAAAAGYIINDYYDIELDKINKATKVVIGNKISKTKALNIYYFLNLGAIISAFLLDFKFALLVIIIIGLLFLYAYKLKKIAIVGNVLVALLSAITILVIAYYKNFNMVFALSILAFIVSWIREIIKDLQDKKGDKMLGHKNMVILFGDDISLWIVRVLLILLAFMLVSFFPLFNKNIYFISQLYFGFLHLQIVYNFYLTFTKQYARQSKTLKVLMLSGVCLTLLI